MSVLTLLFLTSVFYFSLAQSNPFNPDLTSTYQEEVDEFLSKINDAVNNFLTQIVPRLNLDPENQDYFKDTAMNGICSYVNYMLYLMTEDSKNDTDEADDDIIIEIESLGLSVPGIPYQESDDAK